MLGAELVERIKNRIHCEIVAPYRRRYMPAVYRRFDRSTSGKVAENLLEPYKRKRDRKLFQQHVRPTDVFLIGHPKVGNTWMAYMLAILANKEKADQVTMSNVGQYVPIIHGQDTKILDHEDLANPRIFRNEYPVHPDLYPKTLYLVRDPRAVLISYYHMHRVMRPEAAMSLAAFINEYLSEGYIKTFEPNERWDRHVQRWMKGTDQSNRIMVVKYEDTVADRAAVLGRVARFIGLTCTNEDLAKAVSRGSFEEMAQNEQRYGAESYAGEIGKRGRFLRKGKVDGWKEEVNQNLIERIESEFAPVMKVLGYPLAKQ